MPLVKEIFNTYMIYKSLHQIQKYLLNKHNIKWSLSTVKYILGNPIYCRSDENVINYLNSKNIPVYGEPNGCGFITYNSRP
ncbi:MULTISPECIES: recombinase family protein [Clostridium]|uniref:recombinase family protein n=1 Tax=Clostridium TaxID=1485 RepID=UPI00338D65BE